MYRNEADVGPDLRSKYLNDSQFHALVDVLEAHIRRADFTPSEVRQASMLACINYESYSLRRNYRLVIPDHLEECLVKIEKFIEDGG